MPLGVPNQYNGLTSREGLYHAVGQMFTPGIASGFKVRQNTALGMSVLVGGESGVPDDALLYDTSTGALYPMFQSIGSSPIQVTINPASSSQKRITSIVAYCRVGATTDKSAGDNPATVGIMAVDGVPTSGTAQPPTTQVIRAAITGQSAFVVLANINVAQGATRIMNADITMGRSLYSAVKQSALFPHNLPMFSATTSGWVSLSSGIWAIARYDTELYDTVGMFDPSTYKATVPVTGIYNVNARLAIANGGLGTVATALIALYKNNAMFKESGRARGSGNDFTRPNYSICGDMLLEAGDVIDVRAHCSESRNFGGTANRYSEFGMRLVGLVD